MHKCASNLVQKALRVEEELVGPNATLKEHRLACAILKSSSSGLSAGSLRTMAQDKYGNHILQWLLSRSVRPVRALAATRLKEEEGQKLSLQQGYGAKHVK